MNVPNYLATPPNIHPNVFIAPSADIMGDVKIDSEASILYQVVVRADINKIEIGPRSNVQDGSVIHLSNDHGVHVGASVTCGHRAILHACHIEDEVLIGMGAIVMDGSRIGARSIVGAGSLVTRETIIPPGSLVMGSPAKIVRKLSLEEQLKIKSWADKYVIVTQRLAEQHAQETD